MQKILIATGNRGKAKEMLEVLSDLPCEFLTLADLDLENDAIEDGGRLHPIPQELPD